MIANRWARPPTRRVAAVVVAGALLAGCGERGDDSGADGGDDSGADGGADGGDGTVATTSAPVPPTEPVPATTAADGVEAEVVDAEIVSTIELERSDLGFLISDGEAIWATGHDGAVVRIDPTTSEVEELTIGDGLISGQLLPVAVDESIWFSAIQGSHIVRLDRTTLEADPPIEVPDMPGLVVAGPDDRLWLTYLEPAGLRPIDTAAGTVGELVAVETEGEMLGVTAASGALWAPLYDERVLLKLDSTGAEIDRLPTGVGPTSVREFGGWLWHPNWIDGTIARVDPTTLDVTVVDLNAGGPTIEQPSSVTSSDGAIWVRAARLIDGAAMVFRIDPDTASVVGRRTLPAGRRLHQIGGMTALDDRLFVLDRPGRVLLELDTDQFLGNDRPSATTVAGESDELDDAAEDGDARKADVAEAVRTLLATATTPEQMAAGIVDGDRLTDQIAAFKRFFVENLPGEEYEGDVSSVRIDGDVAELEFFVVVAGEPIVEVIQGTAVRQGGRWMLSADSFCRLIATGGIECPVDLGRPG